MRSFKKRVPLGVRRALGSLVQHLPPTLRATTS